MARLSWRRWLAATAALSIAAPLLALGAGPASAKSPTADAGTLVIGGEAGCAVDDNPVTPLVDESSDCNPWRFGSGGHYAELRAMLTDPANFSKASGAFKKGNFTLKSIRDVSAPGALSDIDIFVAAIPIGGGKYDGARLTALQNFVNGGGALVLLNNDQDFGETADWLGYTLRGDRAFFGKEVTNVRDCGFPATYAGEKAPPGSVTVAAGQSGHAVTGGSVFGFGATGEPTVHHTVNVLLTPPAKAVSLYDLNVVNQPATIALNGPRGYVPTDLTQSATDLVVASGGSIDLKAAVTTPTNIVGGLGGISYQEVTAGGTPVGAPKVGDSTFTGLTAGDHYYEATITRAAPVGGTQTSNRIHVIAKATPLATDATSLVNGDGNDDQCPGSGDTINNNIAGSLMSVIQKGDYSATAGPIVVLSDLDLFSNAYQSIKDGANQAINANGRLAMNTFAWLMNQLITDGGTPPAPPAGSTDTYFNLPNPTRVYDSRSLTPIGQGESRRVQVRNIGGVPADATAVIANITAVDATAEGGYFTVYPDGAARPNASTHNFWPGENFANLVVVPVGTNNAIDIYNAFGTTHALVDIIGYTRPVTTGARLRTIAPNRVLDTRNNIGTTLGEFGPDTTRDLLVRGVAGVPATANAVLLNMTVVSPSETGSYITVWPAGAAQPNTSNINTIAYVNRPNLVVAPIGADGKVSVFNKFGQAHVLADVVGYFDPTGVGGSITGLTPFRIMDTRGSAPFGQGQSRLLQIRSNGVPNGAKTVILKVTVDQPTAGGFMTVWPEGNRPNVSNLNFDANMTIPNIVVTQIGADGSIRLYNDTGSTHVIVDLLGFAD